MYIMGANMERTDVLLLVDGAYPTSQNITHNHTLLAFITITNCICTIEHKQPKNEQDHSMLPITTTPHNKTNRIHRNPYALHTHTTYVLGEQIRKGLQLPI